MLFNFCCISICHLKCMNQYCNFSRRLASFLSTFLAVFLTVAIPDTYLRFRPLSMNKYFFLNYANVNRTLNEHIYSLFEIAHVYLIDWNKNIDKKRLTNRMLCKLDIRFNNNKRKMSLCQLHRFYIWQIFAFNHVTLSIQWLDLLIPSIM